MWPLIHLNLYAIAPLTILSFFSERFSPPKKLTRMLARSRKPSLSELLMFSKSGDFLGEDFSFERLSIELRLGNESRLSLLLLGDESLLFFLLNISGRGCETFAGCTGYSGL